jgi:signal peptidase I
VPPGFFFVLGDNRGNSLDSRYKDLGYIPIANVIGTVRTTYWSNEPARFLSSVQ